MRRATAWFVVVGVAILAAAQPVQAADGFWLTVASGVTGSSTPSDYQEWWFETPHGPPPVAITQLNGTGTTAYTAGGFTNFIAGAVPVILHPTDGYAYLADGTKPTDLSEALKRQMAGGRGLASTTPDAGAIEPPPGSALLSISKNADGTLSVSLTDSESNPIGGGSISVPGGGWWVIGLGPNPQDPSTDPGEGPGEPPGNGDPGSGPVTTPEPATLLLAAVGGLGSVGWQLRKRRRTR